MTVESVVLRGFQDDVAHVVWRGFGPARASSVDLTIDLRWNVEASEDELANALTGRVVRINYRYEKRTIANQFLADVSDAIVSASIDANNDRDIFRTARFTISPEGADIDPLADHIAIIAEVLVAGSLETEIQMGLYALNVPRKTFRPNLEVWEVAANDLAVHLLEATTEDSYRVAAAANYITGTNGVRDILDAYTLRHALPTTTLVLAADMTWPPGTPWLRVVNDLLHGANMYSLWFDANGVARTRTRDELSSRTPDVIYLDSDFILAPVNEEADTTRFANQVVVVVEDPNRGILRAVATNTDPDSPTSTVTLGRTITVVLRQNTAADQPTLDDIAARDLEQRSSLYKRMQVSTQPDPRRDAHEVYEITIDGLYEAEAWWARSWSFQCKAGAAMQHNLARVEHVA